MLSPIVRKVDSVVMNPKRWAIPRLPVEPNQKKPGIAALLPKGNKKLTSSAVVSTPLPFSTQATDEQKTPSKKRNRNSGKVTPDKPFRQGRTTFVDGSEASKFKVPKKKEEETIEIKQVGQFSKLSDCS